MSMQSVTIGWEEYNQMLDDRKQITSLQSENARLQAAWDSAFKQAMENGAAYQAEVVKNAELKRIIAESKEQERERLAKQFDESGWHPYAEVIRNSSNSRKGCDSKSGS